MSDNTPTTREREAARAIITWLQSDPPVMTDDRNLSPGELKDCIDYIAAALAEAERGALTRAAEYIRQNYHQHTGDYIDSAPEQLARAIEELE